MEFFGWGRVGPVGGEGGKVDPVMVILNFGGYADV